MTLNRADIAKLIPHAGAMCLLDGVRHWDATSISCVSRSHLDTANPLRADGQLGALCGIEYAGQAMAVHGALSGGTGDRPRTGYLVSLRGVVCRHRRLDTFDAELMIDAAQVMGDQGRVIYEFTLHANTIEILSGRATVVLDAAA
jgi:predicted hotdog family 3-hydroxylacyl-ACP dehydratase